MGRSESSLSKPLIGQFKTVGMWQPSPLPSHAELQLAQMVAQLCPRQMSPVNQETVHVARIGLREGFIKKQLSYVKTTMQLKINAIWRIRFLLHHSFPNYRLLTRGWEAFICVVVFQGSSHKITRPLLKKFCITQKVLFLINLPLLMSLMHRSEK